MFDDICVTNIGRNMEMYKVSFGSNITGSCDYVYVMAKSEQEAREKGKSMLDTHKLVPDFLNSYGRYSVEKVLD